MNIDEKYDALKKMILERIPDTFTVNNNLIEEREYDAYFMPINFNPYKMGGHYYPVIYECIPRSYVGRPPVYVISKGEETTISIWNAILQYKEYDLLADLLILGFFQDTLKHISDDTPAYTREEMMEFCQKARKVLEENNYGRHNPRCKTYLTLNHSELFHNYHIALITGNFAFSNVEGFVDEMMKIIVDAYNSRYFIINFPSEQSNQYAKDIRQRALDRMFEGIR